MRRQPIDPIQIIATEAPLRLCNHPGCEASGDFRAPKSRIELDRYYWFCLEHVRAYNLSWNYYAGMDEGEVEAEIRRDTVWQRPSWKLGERAGPRPNIHGPNIHDPFGFQQRYDQAKAGRKAEREARDPAARANSARDQALAVFDLEPPLTAVQLKARYKVLVKLHHPDAHGGDKAAEEKLKIINQAYATLKASYLT